MRKRYLLLLMLLFPLATIFMSGQVHAQTDAQYNAALTAIGDGASYYITTEVDGTKYYLDVDGYLNASQEYAGIFTLKKVSGGGFKTYGYLVDSGEKRFSNPAASNSIADDHLNASTNNRADWEAQVFFLGDNGKYAIRATNAAGTTSTSGWNWVGQSFWTVKEGPNAGYSFDVTFVWELEVPGDMIKIFTQLNNTLNKYTDQYWDDITGESMNIGSGPGQHSDVETWEKFWNLLQDIYDLSGKFDAERGYAWTGDPDPCPTVEEATAMATAADSMYKVILDSEVPYVPETGYYRIFTAERYKSSYDPSGFVDKAWAASFEKAHANKGVYGTVKRNMANFVWKIIKSENGDSLMLQNAGMGTYVARSSWDSDCVDMTEDPSEAIYFVFDFAGDHVVQYAKADGTIAEEERAIFAIRPAFESRGGYYIHQMGHGDGNKDSKSPFGYYQTDSGKDLEFSFWGRTYTRTAEASDTWTSEWYLEPVPEDEVEKLVEDFEIIKNHDVLVAQNNELRAKVLEDLTVAKDAIKTKIITSASQMSSPFSQNDYGGADGGNLSAGVLIDGDKSTYWHSAFTNTPPERHYIQLTDVQDLVGECEMYFCERAGASNDRPTDFKLYGTDNAELLEPTVGTPWEDNWVLMDSLKVPNFTAGAENTIPFTIETAYPYIRVVCTHTDCGSSGVSYRYFWHAAELQFLTVRPNPNSQYVALGEVAETLDRIYKQNAAVPDSLVTPEMYKALQDAYTAFLAAMVDPTELRNALAAYADVTKGVVEGTEPGRWTSTDIATAFDALYQEVSDYDKGGKYTVAQNHKYAVMLKAMSKSVMEQANGVKTDAWYHIMFPTEKMYTDYGFDPKGAGGDSKIVGDPLEFGYYVVPGVRTDEMGTDAETGEPKATGNYFLEFVNKEDCRAGMYMYFADPEAIEDKDLSMFRFVEHENLWASQDALLQETKENMAMALDMSTSYVKGEPLITDVSQITSNASDKSEGKNIGSLIDGDKATYWHSDYHSEVLEPAYLQFALKEPVSGLIQVDVTRRQGATNGHVVHMYILGSNDAENWTNIGYLETPFTNQNESVTSMPVDLGGSYSYLRFILTKRYGTDSGGNIEFYPFPEITDKSEYNKLWTYFHAAEFQIYPVKPAAELSETAGALRQAYTTANKVIFKDAAAEDVSAAAQAYASFREEFNSGEGKAVLPKGADKVAPVYAIQNKATGLFVNCKGSNNANNSLELIPTFFDYQALGFQRSLIHGTRIDGGNCSYLHSQNFDHRFVTWNATTPNSNSGLVLIEAAEPYEAPESFSFYRNVKPGRIADWCNSVSISPVDAPDEARAYTAVGQFFEGEGEEIETYLALKQVETIVAGEPALFIYGDLDEYNAEDDYVEPIQFTMPGTPELVTEGATVNGLFGAISQYSLKKDEIYFDGNTVGHPDADGGVTVTQCSAVLRLAECPYINAEEDPYDFAICLGTEGAEVVDAVKNLPATIQNLSKAGNVYSMDGKLLRTGATLNSLKTLGKGMYILNGVKVQIR